MNEVVNFGHKRDVIVSKIVTGLLFLSYGSPQSKEELVPYMTSIRRGQAPTETEVQALMKRYDAIGHWDNEEIRHMTQYQFDNIKRMTPFNHYSIGYLHRQPSIQEAFGALVNKGVTHIVAITTAPFYTAVGTGAYLRRVNQANEAYEHVTVDFVCSWWEQRLFREFWMDEIQNTVRFLPEDVKRTYIFTAHSVPIFDNQVVSPTGDYYKEELTTASNYIANYSGLSNWKLAFQSAGPRGEWLGPTVESAIDEAIAEGAEEIIFVPFGFVSSHVEVLYDIDIECRQRVESQGAVYRRAFMPDCNIPFLSAMALEAMERISS